LWNVLTFQENAIRYLRFQVGLMDKTDNVTMSKANASSSGIQTGQVLPVAVAVALLLPALTLLLFGLEPAPLVRVLAFGAAFIGAALLLTWGAELAQLDLPQGLAVAILAFIAILPEYAVDLLFAWQAADDPSKASLALANMTGANRLLIGIGWSLVVIIGAIGARRAFKKNPKSDKSSRKSSDSTGSSGYSMQLSRLAAVDVVLLGFISLYMLQMLVRSSLTLVDTIVLFGAFGFYVWRLWRAPKEEPEFIGPPALISTWRPALRRTATIGLMAVAAAVILLSAEPFSSSLVTAGNQFGIQEFLMVQWIAPLATESAELIPAAIFAWRQSADEGLGTLLSSKINQWTLLVGAIPIAYSLSSGTLSGLPIDTLQQQEIFLTAAQSIFAVLLLINLRLNTREAGLILTLFLADFAASVTLSPDEQIWARLGFSSLYLILAIGIAIKRRRLFAPAIRDSVVIDPKQLAREN